MSKAPKAALFFRKTNLVPDGFLRAKGQNHQTFFITDLYFLYDAPLCVRRFEQETVSSFVQKHHAGKNVPRRLSLIKPRCLFCTARRREAADIYFL